MGKNNFNINNKTLGAVLLVSLVLWYMPNFVSFIDFDTIAAVAILVISIYLLLK